jgi:hypothetical protein
VEIRFSYAHQGAQQGATVEVRWGGTALVSRTVGSSETYVAGRAEAGVHPTGAQWDVQSWGASTALAAGAGNAGGTPSAGVLIDFLGRLAGAATDTLALRSYTVVRYPAMAQP